MSWRIGDWLEAAQGAMSHNSDLSDDECDEMTPLEYARANGLCLDYLCDPVSISEAGKLRAILDHSLADDSHLHRFAFGSELGVEERLSISKEAAFLLASVSREQTAEEIDALVLPMLNSRNGTKKLKIELPLLHSDHEGDCKEFGRRDGFEVKLKDVKLPLEIVSEENGQGLKWPSHFKALGTKTTEELKQERISVSKNTIGYLSGALASVWTEEDEKNLWEREQSYKRNTAREPVTPPLSPIHLPPKPYEPTLSDPAFQLPIFSDPTSPTKNELEAIEKKLFQQDIPTPLRDIMSNDQVDYQSSDTYPGDVMINLGDIYSPMASLDNSTSPLAVEIQRFKRDGLKVEEPLTPQPPTIAPKSVRFSQIVEEMDLEPISCTDTPALESTFFEDAFGDAAEMATKQSEQEKLIEADATARVDVPVMDFAMPIPPWKVPGVQGNPATLESSQKALISKVIGGNPQKWKGSNQVLLNLRHNPFPHNLSKVALEDNFEASDYTWEDVIKFSGDEEVLDSSSLTWKPPGLRVVLDNLDDDEIEQERFPKEDSRDLRYLIKKRKIQLEESGSFDIPLPTLSKGIMQDSAAMSGQQQRNTPSSGDFISAAQETDSQSKEELPGSLLGGAFSAINSLDNYLELRGSKKPKLLETTYFAAKPEANQSLFRLRPIEPKPHQQNTMQLPIRKSPIGEVDHLPLPVIQVPNVKINLIVSTSVLKNRSLVKHLETLLPSLVLIERDFSTHNTTIWMPGSVTRSPITSPLDSEADFIVSPSMGIVLATLQKIKQKPLPGQKSKPPIRDRLEKVSARYENIVVLVSEGRSDETTMGLDANDCLGLAEFVGYCQGLNASIVVQFVGGGVDTLSRWIGSVIAQHHSGEESDLLQEETHWELFLRRAGMNAFAAQTIISSVKAPDGVDTTSPTKAGHFGLTAFVEMGREQRVARFRHICGRRILDSASAVIDARWD